MTLAAMWIESRGDDGRQLCVASDSRTKPGPIEGVTKVVLFGRPDVAGVWAGDYRYASLLVAHLDAFFTSSEAMRRRDIDLARALAQAREAVRRHLVDAVSGDLPTYEINPEAQAPEATTLLLGGYSIRRAEFRYLRIQYSPHDGMWLTHLARLDPSDVIFLGDERKSAKSSAKSARLWVVPATTASWRMEPLAAIHRAIEEPTKGTIGGVPQLAKVYMHGVAAAYGFVDWKRCIVTSRATRVWPRGVREMALSRRLVDLSAWRLEGGTYAAMSRGFTHADLVKLAPRASSP